MAQAILQLSIWIFLLVCLGFVEITLGDAILSLNFNTFSNYDGHDRTGVCCDGNGYKLCTSKCDHSFDVCISNGRKESLKNQCPFGRFVTGAITDENYIQFGSSVGKSSNPLLFPVRSWPPRLFLSVLVVDVDSTTTNHKHEREDDVDDAIAHLERTIIISPNNITKTILLREKVELSMDVRGFCAPNYYGLQCGIYCNAHNEVTRRYSCDDMGRRLCFPGWTGQDCNEDIDECASSPCTHGGACIDLINAFRCECTHLFSGSTCQDDVDECLTETDVCFNGTCHNEIGSYRCECRPGWTGQDCSEDIDECSSSPCTHGGTCIDLINAFRCECTHQFTGATCQDDVDECLTETDVCSNGTCHNEIGSYRCECRPGFTGSHCQEDINECNSSPCQNGALCSESITPGEFVCTCPSYFTGQLCEENVNECITTSNEPPCQNNGTCVDTYGSFYCDCTQFWTGDWCQENINECESSSEPPCSPIGSKSCLNLDEGFKCVCTEGWTGESCDEDVDECKILSPKPCFNNSVCVNSNGSYRCDCVQGWSGERCENDVNECDHFDDDVTKSCQNGGTCVNLQGGYRCQCPRFWSGEFCDVDVNECELGVCSKNSTKMCENFPGGFDCVCRNGWTGIMCEDDIDECKEDPMICFEGSDPGTKNNNSFKLKNEVQRNVRGGSKNKNHDGESKENRLSKGENYDNLGKEKSSRLNEQLPTLDSNRISNGNFVCTNLFPGYMCSCGVGWTGQKCDYRIGYEEVELPKLKTAFSSEAASSASTRSTWVIVVPLLIVIMIVVALVLVYLHKRKKKPKVELKKVTYVNEGFEERTTTLPRMNGLQNDNNTHTGSVEIPHLRLNGPESTLDGQNQVSPTVNETAPRLESNDATRNVEVQVHYEVPEGSDDDDDDTICRSPTMPPPISEVIERSRSQIERVTSGIESSNSEEATNDSGVFGMEGSIWNEITYVSRVDFIVNDGNVLCSTNEEDNRYEQLPYIDAPPEDKH